MIDAIISVRTASTRLPGKCLLPLGTTTVIQHVVHRCIGFGFSPIIATTDDPSDDALVKMLRPIVGERIHKGPAQNKMLRWAQACERFGVKQFITVDADDPFFDGGLCQQSMDQLEARGLDVVAPNMDAYLGSHGWAFKTSSIVSSLDNVNPNISTEMVWKHLLPGLKQAMLGFYVEPIEKDIRLTLDYEQDYWVISTVHRILGSGCTRSEIVDFFMKHPGLTVINQYRNDDWKKRQVEG